MTAPLVVAPDPAGLAAAVDALRQGRPIVVPTDTVYGLAVRAGDPVALDELFVLKRRPAERSIAVLVADAAQAAQIAKLSEHDRRAADAFWPGDLTLVLDRLPGVDPSIGRHDATVGVRCPGGSFVRELARAVGPISTTSANISGAETPDEAVEAAAMLDGHVAVIVDGGPCAGSASTVARLDVDGAVTVFRQGRITAEQLERVVQAG